MEEIERHRAIERPKVISFLDVFRGNGDLEKLRYSLDSWSKTTGTYFGFKGPNGQMYLNQLTKDGEAAGIGAQLAQWLPPPASEQQASRWIDELAALTADLRKQGSAAAIGRAPFLLSWIWWIQEPTRWVPIWPSRENPLVQLGFVKSGYPADEQGRRYLDYLYVVPGTWSRPDYRASALVVWEQPFRCRSRSDSLRAVLHGPSVAT